MLLDAAEAGEESPPYVAPGSRTPFALALAALYTQVRGAGPRTPDTLKSLERGRRGREEETRRAARARLLQHHERRDKESTRERSRSRSRQQRQEPEQTAGEDIDWDWVCMCRMCVLHPGKPCATNFPMKRVKEDSREEQGEAEKRRYRLASTWTPPRKRSISLQGPIIVPLRTTAGATPPEGADRSSSTPTLAGQEEPQAQPQFHRGPGSAALLQQTHDKANIHRRPDFSVLPTLH